ncbi:hypothetical protein B5E82_14555 [Lachnoclostridium sp. An138]|nr:hypothetical protein B5E82_14555 [Lachnoclostridium sp. An138]
MKTRKTKKRNIIRRTVAFLLCMTMVLGLGMQDVIEQVYAEGLSAVSEQSADVPETQEVELTETTTPDEESEPEASGETTGSEETAPTTPEEPKDPEVDTEPTEPANPADTEENTDVTTPPTETTEPSAPAEPTTPADGTENTEPAEPEVPETPAVPDGSESSDETTPGEDTETDEEGTPSEGEELPVEEEPVSELTYAAEDGSFSVKATAVSEDVDLSGIEIHAAQVQEDGEEYAAAEELVAAALDAESRQIEEFLAYDIWFTYTESGETADLSGQVQISLEYTEPEFPEGTDMQLEVFCLNDGAAEAAGGTDALEAGYDLYALAWTASANATYETVVDGVKVIVKAKPGVLPDGAVLSVEKIESEETEEEIKEAVAEDIAANNTTIQDMMVFDIRFLVDGQEVQPDGAVTVEFENTGYGAENGISVYHVDDENANATNMEATTETEADVAFETTHFSQYVIINNGNSEVKVTIQHFLEDAQGSGQPVKIYRDFETTLKTGTEEQQLTGFTKEDEDYALKRVVKVVGSEEEPVSGERIIVDSDAVFKCYYTAITGTYENGTTFFDYVNGDASDRRSINYFGNYSGGNDKNTYNNRLGTIGAANDYRLMVERTVTVNGTEQSGRFNANAFWRIDTEDGDIGNGSIEGLDDRNYTRDQYNGSDWASNPHDFSWPIITGLITRLSGDKCETVNFACDEPGFFSKESKNGKTIYEDYDLVFDKNGNRYTLSRVEENNVTVVDNLSQFFPLNNKNDGQKNEYFGMRYDFEFSVGDYLGDMTYSFTGDDDLWVFLDGELILDLGGIHAAYEGSEYNELTNSLWPTEVDIWSVLLEKEGIIQSGADYTEDDKLQVDTEAKHTVTVLYMERGGEASNCYMEFVMPNVQASDPVISATPKAELQFTKINADTKAGLPGATFTLYSDEQCTTMIEQATSDANGIVKFNTRLKAGTYYLKETAAPDGYIANSEKYTVTVTATTDSATAVITNSKNEKITSISNTEIVKAIEKDKTAHVVNWDERIYEIDLSASSRMQSSIPGTAKAVDVMLVLDASGSMCEYSGSLSGEEVSWTSAQSNYNSEYYFEQNGTLYKVSYARSWFGEWRWRVYSEYGSDGGEQQWLETDRVNIPATVNTDFISRNEAMKAAATEFVNLLDEKSPDSKVGIAGYSDGLMNWLALTTVGTDKDSIINAINRIDANSSTYAYHGLQYANTQLSSSESGNDKIVVLLSDGADNGENSAEWVANTLKNNGTTIYSVGFKVNSSTKNFLEGIATDSGHYYGADSMEELVNSFKLIVEGGLEGTTIENATVTDVIDSRFDVVDENGNLLSDGAEIEDVNGNIGILRKNSSGEWYVEWSGIDIAPKSEGSNLPGWSAKIYVKAKADYIGGNDVPTNAAGSGISFSGNTVPFDPPKVNVKVELDISNKEVTIYKGDTVPTGDTILAQLFSTEYIGKYGVTENSFTWGWYDNEDCTGTPLTTDQLVSQNPEADTTYYLKVTYNAGDPSDASNTNTTLGGTIYHAGVADGAGNYIVEAVNDGLEAGSTQNDTFTDYEDKHYGVYKINVISGEITITKKLTEAAAEAQTFSFRITKDEAPFNPADGGTEWTVDVAAGAAEGTQTILNLARGNYVITEVSRDGYELRSVEINIGAPGGTNCENTRDGMSATFGLGKDMHGNNVIGNDYTYDAEDGGTKGAVTFTNAAVIGNWRIVKRSSSDTTLTLEGAVFKLESNDSGSTPGEPGGQTKTTYYGKSDNAGIVKWYSDEACTNEVTFLRSGEYTLSEIKAPVGYTLSEETWTVTLLNNRLESVTKADETPIVPRMETDESGKEIYVYTFYDAILYDLPSTGGPGIYLYMLGGVALMMAGTLLVYKKRKEEVLRS